MVIDLVTIQPLKSLLQWSSPMVGASEVTIGAGLSLATLQALSAFSKVEVQWVPRQRSPWRILEMGEKISKIMAKSWQNTINTIKKDDWLFLLSVGAVRLQIGCLDDAPRSLEIASIVAVFLPAICTSRQHGTFAHNEATKKQRFICCNIHYMVY